MEGDQKRAAEGKRFQKGQRKNTDWFWKIKNKWFSHVPMGPAQKTSVLGQGTCMPWGKTMQKKGSRRALGGGWKISGEHVSKG